MTSGSASSATNWGRSSKVTFDVEAEPVEERVETAIAIDSLEESTEQIEQAPLLAKGSMIGRRSGKSKLQYMQEKLEQGGGDDDPDGVLAKAKASAAAKEAATRRSEIGAVVGAIGGLVVGLVIMFVALRYLVPHHASGGGRDGQSPASADGGAGSGSHSTPQANGTSSSGPESPGAGAKEDSKHMDKAKDKDPETKKKSNDDDLK